MFALLLATPGRYAAQESPRPQARSQPVSSAPRVDGVLDEACWSLVEPIGELTQVEPDEGAPPIDRTEVRVLHGPDALYVGFRCFDADPAAIVRTTRQRDGDLEDDDRVEIVLDTFGDGRNAYFFEINAAGAKGDALVTANGDEVNDDWDGIWDAAARVDEAGWTAELAIPFRTVAFASGDSTWGFNVERYVGRRREHDRWANPSLDHGIENVYRAGELTGLEGMRGGHGLDVVPFFVTTWRDERDGGRGSVFGNPGFDAYYRILPGLTLAGTVNTDFAGTEVDERQINLTRFPLFLPEKRRFFLEDAGVFRFGLDSVDDGEDASLIPFFSRRIGLDEDGREVPIDYGAKLSGRAGRYGVGVLGVRTGELDDLDAQGLFAGRVTRDVGEQSVLGAIVTHGDPTGEGDDDVYGLDASFRSDVLDGDRDLVTSAYWLRSDDDDGSASAYGLELGAPGDRWTWELRAEEIQDDFDAALGFVPRTGIRSYSAYVDWAPRPDLVGVRQLDASVFTEIVTDTSGDLETWTTDLVPFGLTTEEGDEVVLGFEHTRDELFEDFEIDDGVVIPVGVYDNDAARLVVDTSGKRPLSGSGSVEAGSFYDGDIVSWYAELVWRPGPGFSGELAYERDDVSLPGGDFTAEIALLRAAFTFTPEVAWTNLVQWDSDSETVGLQSRLRWLPVPGRELLLVFEEVLDTAGGGSTPLDEELSLKLTYTLRF